MSTVKIGLCQMHVSYDKGENLAEAGRMIAQAAEEGDLSGRRLSAGAGGWGRV